MNRAHQQALSQEANMALVQIRNVEINYFTSFFLNFGTQAAALVGAITGSLSQTPALLSPADYVWKFTYFTSAAMVVALSTHLMVVTVYIAVFGEGLALRGPEGAMVQTIDGMVEEQRLVAYIFILDVFFFVLQEVGMFFNVMSPYHSFWAYFNSAFVLLMLAATFASARRIYLRFYWEKPLTGWRDLDIDPQEDLRDLNPDVADSIYRPPNLYAQAKRSNLKRYRLPFSRRGYTAVGTDEGGGGEEGEGGGEGGAYDGRLEMAGFAHTCVDISEGGGEAGEGGVCGYLSVKMRRSPLQHANWRRRYFVLKDFLLYYYEDRPAFLGDSPPIHSRPIELEGYSLVAGALHAPYHITLVPIDEADVRKSWKFRCDTLAEFQAWIGVFAAAIRAHSAHRQVLDRVLVRLPQSEVARYL
ncbi:hypothetical protein B484DRAFT_402570 [Ochromonadaceae sp. CCMP2298]|nr:hypothetical protein B484DRAFT_402570 [Ochromonadaceae sp. CCMP2298]